jgi:allantoin racemase
MIMKILVVNPNSTPSITAKIRAAAYGVAAPGTEIIAVNPNKGPASIEGYYDEAFSVPGLLEEIVRGEDAGCDGHVIACFDDSGVDAARAVAIGPVLGICEAAMRVASMISTSFAVVTTLPRSVRIIEDLAVRYGMERRCRRVRAADVAVLDLEEEGREARDKVRLQVRRAIEEDGAEAVVLGCAGMADLTRWLAVETGVPVIDGVTAAVKLLEALGGLGLRTSKSGAYATPAPKRYLGAFEPNSPRAPIS